MTLHDRLNEIIDQHDNQLQRWDKGNAEYPTPDTITAIISAFTERLPGDHTENDFGYDSGWNAYRQEVLKVLEEIPDFTKGGHTTGPYSIDSST